MPLGQFLQNIFQPQQAQPQVQAPGEAFANPMQGMGAVDRFRFMRQNNPEALMMLSAGLMNGNLGGGFQAAGQSMADFQTRNSERMAQQSKENKTREWLVRNRGMSPEDADAIIAGGAVSQYMKPGGADGDTRFSLQPVWGEDDQGNPMLGTIGNDGSFKAIDTGGFKLSTGTEQIDLGDRFAIKDKRSGQIVGYLPKENYQESFDKARGGEEGKMAAGLPQMKSKAAATLDALDSQRVVVNQDIDRALSAIQSSPTLLTGIVGGLTNAIPGTPAYDLAQLLVTIKANIGFDKLQSMRENSPTGGALGQVSDFENRQLQAVFGNLEQAQSSEQIMQNLTRLKEILAQMQQARRDAFSRDFGGVGEGAPQPIMPQGGGNVTGTGVQWSIEP